MNEEEALERIRAELGRSAAGREQTAAEVADVVRRTHGYRWVGIYDVRGGELRCVNWSGRDSIAHPTGLGILAAQKRRPIVVDDAGDSRAAMHVPVVDHGHVLATIGVESDRPRSLGDEDRAFVERCAEELAAAWTSTSS